VSGHGTPATGGLGLSHQRGNPHRKGEQPLALVWRGRRLHAGLQAVGLRAMPPLPADAGATCRRPTSQRSCGRSSAPCMNRSASCGSTRRACPPAVLVRHLVMSGICRGHPGDPRSWGGRADARYLCQYYPAWKAETKNHGVNRRRVPAEIEAALDAAREADLWRLDRHWRSSRAGTRGRRW
jgi:hypothetical protein